MRGAACEGLESRWTRIGTDCIHARVCVDLSPPNTLPVVLVHGVGVASRFMVPTAELLAPHHPVYAPDLPGFGESSKPRHALNLTELTDALAGWMRVVGLERVALLGNSVGCQIIADLALRYPDRIDRAVLQGPTVDPSGRTVRQQILRWLRNNRHERPSQALISAKAYWKCGMGRLIRTFRYALDDRIEEKLPQMYLPTLVVRGSLDTIVPQRWAEEVTRLLPEGRLVVLHGAPHTVVYNAAPELVRVALPFLGGDGLSQEGEGN